MSQTLTVGAVGAGHWTYMAGVMERCLQQAIESRSTEVHVPRNVWKGARRFLSLALEAARDEVPANPAASINAFKIAADAASQPAGTAPRTRSELEDRLSDYRSFLDRFLEPHELPAADLEKAKALRIFFLRLHSEGEAQRYSRLVSQPWPSIEARIL